MRKLYVLCALLCACSLPALADNPSPKPVPAMRCALGTQIWQIECDGLNVIPEVPTWRTYTSKDGALDRKEGRFARLSIAGGWTVVEMWISDRAGNVMVLRNQLRQRDGVLQHQKHPVPEEHWYADGRHVICPCPVPAVAEH